VPEQDSQRTNKKQSVLIIQLFILIWYHKFNLICLFFYDLLWLFAMLHHSMVELYSLWDRHSVEMEFYKKIFHINIWTYASIVEKLNHLKTLVNSKMFNSMQYSVGKRVHIGTFLLRVTNSEKMLLTPISFISFFKNNLLFHVLFKYSDSKYKFAIRCGIFHK
jgi:hypothetical protein